MKKFLLPVLMALCLCLVQSQSAMARPSSVSDAIAKGKGQGRNGKKGQKMARFDLNHDGTLDDGERQQALNSIMSNPKLQARLQKKGMTVDQFRTKVEQRLSRWHGGNSGQTPRQSQGAPVQG